MKYLKYTLMALLALFLFMYAIRDEAALAQQDGDHWCDMVKTEVWHSSQDEYIQRCGE